MGVYVEPNINDKYNLLCVKSKPFKKFNSEYWIKCQCDCGTIKDFRKRDVLRGRVRSCGCLQKEAARKLCDINRKLSGNDSAFNLLFARYKKQASDRNLKFSLNKAQFKDVTGKPCHYCKTSPSRTSLSQNKLPGSYAYSGIDRVDNNIGYVVSNIVPCCKTCNYMKHTMDKQEFINQCKLIASHRA